MFRTSCHSVSSSLICEQYVPYPSVARIARYGWVPTHPQVCLPHSLMQGLQTRCVRAPRTQEPWCWSTVPPLVCYGCHNKVSPPGELKQQKCIFTCFWRLKFEIKVLGVWMSSGALSLLGWWMAVFSLHSHMLVAPYMTVSSSALLTRTPVLLG